jgi:hypothetical protein
MRAQLGVQGFNPTMSERVQLLLSDRILGMSLVPEGRVWNYGVGLTQMWAPSMSYAMSLDTPLLFWAEEHRPTNFLTVRHLTIYCLPRAHRDLCSSRTWRPATTAPTWRTVSPELACFISHHLYSDDRV